ncbi:hypothetical protein H0H87_004446 [Tephrocybe sp. NHM501043]|nr:hypothetical protein H0H87_004446 [Tephrocybe sp. NHM501043]
MSLEKHPSNDDQASQNSSSKSDIDLLSYHEKHAGRLIIDPEEAKIELGENVATQLKLTTDGTKVLWPQPTDSPDDPQTWSSRRKAIQLIIITLAAIVPDFDSGIGIAAIFALAEQYDTNTGVINNLTSKYVVGMTYPACLTMNPWGPFSWSIFLLGRF